MDAAAYTIGSGGAGVQALTLNDSGSITANNGINANQVFNANLTLGTDGSAQSYAVTNSDTGNSITFAGAVSGGTGGIAGAKTLNINATGESLSTESSPMAEPARSASSRPAAACSV